MRRWQKRLGCDHRAVFDTTYLVLTRYLRAAAGKIAFLREYCDPTRASKAMNTPILDRD